MDPYKFSKYFTYGRSVGQNCGTGFHDGFLNRMYRQFRPRADRVLSVNGSADTLGVFNLEFSPDGKFLVAACADKSVRILDAGREKCVYARRDAHEDCVNCIQFLDSRMFATGSDDKTIGLWDIRNMKEKAGSMVGHDAWVKSLAYMPESRVLLSSALDGDIMAWEMNNPNADGSIQPRDIIQLNGLMRMALTPDSSKLIVTNSCGYLMVFHDLDIWKMREQYAGIKPNLYRLMQVSGIPLTGPIRYTPLFVAKRNRLELITDFPSGSSACMISTLILHPDGKRCLTRHVTNTEQAEFTCMHDIDGPRICGKKAPEDDEEEDVDNGDHNDERGSNDPDPRALGEEEDANEDEGPRRKRPRLDSSLRSQTTSSISRSTSRASESSTSSEVEDDQPGPSSAPVLEDSSDEIFMLLRRGGRRVTVNNGFSESGEGLPANVNVPTPSAEISPSSTGGRRRRYPQSSDVLRSVGQQLTAREDIISRIRTAASRFVGNRSGTAPFQIHVVSLDTWEALNTIRETRVRETESLLANASSPSRASEPGESRWCLYSSANRHSLRLHAEGRCKCEQPLGPGPPDGERRFSADDIFPNAPRMTHYVQEANVQQGYIKEISVSPDGRVIASPYGNGHRLLMFDSECREPCGSKSLAFLDDPAGKTLKDHRSGAAELVEAGTSFSHSSAVLCTRFAPFHSSLVTGSLAGEVVWHYPHL